MRKAIILAAAMSFCAAAAQADLFIGLQVDGGPMTLVASGTDDASFSGPFGDWFNIQQITASTDNAINKLISASFNLLGTAPRTLIADVTVTGQSTLVSLLSTLQSFVMPANGSVELSTWYDPGNGVFATVIPLAAQGFNSPGSVFDVDSASLCNPLCSITAQYVIHSGGRNQDSFSSAISVVEASAVPEPGTLALLGGWLAGAGLFLRRRRA